LNLKRRRRVVGRLGFPTGVLALELGETVERAFTEVLGAVGETERLRKGNGWKAVEEFA
jgi:hypothetical protein